MLIPLLFLSCPLCVLTLTISTTLCLAATNHGADAGGARAPNTGLYPNAFNEDTQPQRSPAVPGPNRLYPNTSPATRVQETREPRVEHEFKDPNNSTDF